MITCSHRGIAGHREILHCFEWEVSSAQAHRVGTPAVDADFPVM
jgi:hypothetical protein